MGANTRGDVNRVGLTGTLILVGVASLAPPDVWAQSCADVGLPDPGVQITAGNGPRGIEVLDVNRDGALDLVTADALAGTITFGYGDGTGGFQGTFTPPVVPVAQPWAIAVADFDRDGRVDLATGDRAGNTIRALLGDGVGGVQLPLPAAVVVGGNPGALAAGDFNLDGFPDLASANASGSLQIVTGGGDGTFVPNGVGILGVAGTPQDLVTGDFNRDGWLDVAAADPGGVAAVILALGDGAGGWLGSTRFSVPLLPSSVATADVDLDGDLDVVVGDSTIGSLLTLLGDGAGNLVPQAPFPGPLPLTTSVVLADFNSDGLPDLGTTGLGSVAVAVGFGDGAGGFGTMVPFTVAEDPFDIAVGDFDQDGRLDIVASGEPVDQAVLLANQFGIPCPESSFARAGRLKVDLAGGNPAAIVEGDWNDDAVPDLAIAHGGSISVLLGDGRLGFPTLTNYTIPFTNSPNVRRVVVTADFNLDSRPDLATINPSSADINSDSVSVLINNGGGTFLGPTIIPVGANPWGLAAGDFNGDGAPDLVSADRGGISVTFLPGQGDGTFGASLPSPLGLGGIRSLVAGDIDGDLILDVAVTHTSGNVVRWYRGDGAGGFVIGGTYGVGNFPQGMDIGDLNGDGRPDIVVANIFDDSVSVLLNTGGAFAPAVTYPVGDEPHWAWIGQADGLGALDIVVPNRNSADVTLLFNDGAGAFPTSSTIQGYASSEAAILLDADRNGTADLAVVGWRLSGGLYLVPGDGAGGFGPVRFDPGADNRTVASGDFDRDGRPDLVTLASGSGDLAFLKGQGNGTFAAPALYPTGLAGPRGAGIGDFDRDGDLDVLVGGNLQVALLRGDGSGGFIADPPLATSGTPTVRGIAVGDFDRDGALDFVHVDSGASSVVIHYGDGAGGFVAPATTGVTAGPAQIVTLDFNRDGILDVAVSGNTLSLISLLQGRATRGTPFTVRPNLVTGDGALGLVAADFDRDGITDLAVAQDDAVPGSVGYFRGTGNPSPPFFAARTDVDLDPTDDLDADGVTAADVNGDGRLDLLVACRGGPQEERASVRVLLGTGNATPGSEFLGPDSWAVPLLSPSSIVVDDLDNDGKPDFVTAESLFATSWVSVVLNSNCLPRRLRATRNVSTCNAPLTPFATQPAVQVEDHGGNPVQCNDIADPVAVGILPGTGTAGAILGGDNPLPTTAGVADWATGLPLYIDLPGIKYRLEFNHPAAGRTFSRTLSLAPTLAVTGPDEFCASVGDLFLADTGFDSYAWFIDPPSLPASFAESLTIGPGALLAGPHSVQVDATVDACSVSDGKPFNAHADLSNVMAGLSGSSNMCTTCPGGTATESHSDGWLVAHQWGYRDTSGGSITDIPGETGATYDLRGSDFPGVGSYFLVVRTTPTCGSVQTSNEIPVTITATPPSDDVQYFTITSRSTENVLEWVNPPLYDTARIRFTAGAGCVPPDDPLTSGTLLVDKVDLDGPADRDRFVHGGRANGTTYCYTIFVDTGGGYSGGRSNRGRPMDTSGAIKWAFSIGVFSLTAPTVGGAGIIATSNEPVLHAMERGLAGGEWPAGWLPRSLTGLVQSRSPIVPISVGGANPVVYLASQDGRVHVVDGVQGGVVGFPWAPEPLGTFPTLPGQAAPAGMFSAFGGSFDYLLVGTRDTGNDNRVYAIDPIAGGAIDFFDNGGGAGAIGIINGMGSVDYGNDRFYFASHDAGGGSLWSVNLLPFPPATMSLRWSRSLGDIQSSPVLDAGTVYVGSPLAGGTLYAVDAATGNPGSDRTFVHGDGQVKGFVFPDRASGDLYFATDNFAWALNDNGTTITNLFPGGITLSGGVVPTSAVLFIPGSHYVYVGGDDGRLYEIDVSGGAPVVNSLVLGDGLAAVGAPSYDYPNGLLHVGTEAGIFYAVAVPLP